MCQYLTGRYRVPTVADIDVCGIGSALVDILVKTDAGIITEFGLVKGSMHLMDVGRSEAIHAKVDEGIHQSGGSCANTIAGVAALGGSTAFIGRVADDPFGFV